jgi:type II secretory pathway predicted ATPase ExeA
MYTQFYNFSERPFSLLPDPDYLFFSHQHQTALALLETAVINNSGFCMLSGEIGAGKTTLLRELLNRLDEDIIIGLVNNTHASFGSLMQWILGAFGLVPVSQNNVDQYQQFVDFVISEYAKNRHTLLIIDEAQQLTPESMEELRMLSNINSDKDFVLQVIIAGQNELRVKLQSPELTQFAQRISIDYHLEYLDMVDTSHYIRHRLQHAGGAPDLFDMSACRAIFENTGGVPRLINRLCDICLVYGYAAESKIISSNIVNSVIEDKQAGEFVDVVSKDNVDESHELPSAQIDEAVLNLEPEHSPKVAHAKLDPEIGQGDLGLSLEDTPSRLSKPGSDYEPIDDDTIFSVLDNDDTAAPDSAEPRKIDDFDIAVEMPTAQSAAEIPDLYSSGNSNRRAILPMLLIALFSVVSIFAVLDITGHEPEFVAEYKNKFKGFTSNRNQLIKQASKAESVESIDIQEKHTSSNPIIKDRINTSPMIVNREKVETTQQAVADSITVEKPVENNDDIRIQTNHQLSQEKAQLLRNNIQKAVNGMVEKSETIALDAALEKEAELASIDDVQSTDKEEVVTVKKENIINEKIKKMSDETRPTQAPVVVEHAELPKSDMAAVELVDIPKSKTILPDQNIAPSVTNDSVSARRAAAHAALKRDIEQTKP